MQTVLVKVEQDNAQLQQVFDLQTNEYCTKNSAQYINQKLLQTWSKGAKDHAKQRRIRSNRLAPKLAVPQAISRKTGQFQKFTLDSIQRIQRQIICQQKALLLQIVQLKQIQEIRCQSVPVWKTSKRKFQDFQCNFPAT